MRNRYRVLNALTISYFPFNLSVISCISKSFQVLGTKRALWLLPMFSKDDLDNVPSLQGTYFPMHGNPES